MKLGFIINPIAGLGGKVGLKGTDGMAEKAIALAPQKAARALAGLKEASDQSRPGKEGLLILTPPGPMGEEIVRAAGFSPQVLDMPLAKKTSGADTIAAVQKI